MSAAGDCATISRVSTAAEDTIPWPPANPPDPTYLDDRLNHWAEATPDDTAMVFGDRSWTWREWHDRVHRAAGGLREIGIGRGDVVAFVDKKHPARVEITLAASSIGAANAIVDWRMDADQIARVLNSCGATVVFVGSEFASTLDRIADRLDAVQRVIEVSEDGRPGCPYEDFVAESTHVADGPDVLRNDVCMIRYSRSEDATPTGLRLSHREIIDSNASEAGLEFLPVLAAVHAGRASTIERED